MLLLFIDKFFFVFHTVLILFNLFGQFFKKTRVIHLILFSLTTFSWFILGIWYGIGYCPCTDYHWQVRMKLGHFDMPHSYIKFLLDSLTGGNFSPFWVDVVTFMAWGFILVSTVIVHVKERRRKKQFFL